MGENSDKDEEKAQVLKTSSAAVFNSKRTCSQRAQDPELEDWDGNKAPIKQGLYHSGISLPDIPSPEMCSWSCRSSSSSQDR